MSRAEMDPWVKVGYALLFIYNQSVFTQTLLSGFVN